MKKEDPRWRNVLNALCLICLLVVLFSLGCEVWLANPENSLPFEPVAIRIGAYFIYFSLQAILNWKENRARAIVDLSGIGIFIMMVLYFTFR